MSIGQPSERGSARLIAVCAVLLGLFLMHGAPATAAEGCHGAMPSVTVPMHDGHAAPTMASTAPPTTAQSAQAARAGDGSAMHGVPCVSTPAHERNPLPTAGLYAAGALPVAWFPAGLRAATGWTRRRGPPAGGRDLLIQVCVART
ncbi:hypothetical protein OHA79_37140 [Streptomyces sp. NBC_00841]|uniref:hypothetical protein n=1 Tax=unclassified Streptomyces TaxID=2593676 RepID=UPI0022529BCA|nr:MULTISPECIES: hypothetical protein [unclassified Streptomyces]MCX4531444.1 hypothetical protein [Streptomyces sp. NBC_01669]WSA02978.1 hypothetical protein OHA79_37140 [Streptomyces sp. NBC_00841]